MPLICAGTPLLRKSSSKSDREVCDMFVAAVNSAFAAKSQVADTPLLPMLATVPVQTIKGEDPALLVVLQREAGAVAPGEVNPITKSALQSRVCSIDATTCLLVGLRDPYSGTTSLAHFDEGGEQVEEGIPLMLNFMPAVPITSTGLISPEARDELVETLLKHKAKRIVQVYMLGAVKYDKFSHETLSNTLRHLADDTDVVYDVVLHGTCVWTQNLLPSGKNLIHRGLMIDARTGAPTPVECDTRRAYPGGRLRGLRCFDDKDKRISAITLMPGETIAAAAPVDEVGKRRGLQHVIMVRPFKYPDFGPLNARKPLSVFQAMSTSPEMEPADFAETLKSSVVFGSLAAPEKIFTPHPNNPRKLLPVAFQLTIGDLSPDAAASPAPSAEGIPSSTAPAAASPTDAPPTEDPAAPASEPAAKLLGFSWVQISPAAPPTA